MYGNGLNWNYYRFVLFHTCYAISVEHYAILVQGYTIQVQCYAIFQCKVPSMTIPTNFHYNT